MIFQIALSVLEAVGNIPAKVLERVLVAGELSLDGKVREVEGSSANRSGGKNAGISHMYFARKKCK